jgi:hypothetical protein
MGATKPVAALDAALRDMANTYGQPCKWHIRVREP